MLSSPSLMPLSGVGTIIQTANKLDNATISMMRGIKFK